MNEDKVEGEDTRTEQWAYQGKSTELTGLDKSPVKQPLRCWTSWIRIKRIE